jgi:hypothetical protein
MLVAPIPCPILFRNILLRVPFSLSVARRSLFLSGLVLNILLKRFQVTAIFLSVATEAETALVLVPVLPLPNSSKWERIDFSIRDGRQH